MSVNGGTDKVKYYFSANYMGLKGILKQADFYYTSPAFIGSSVARTQVGNLIANCLTMTGSDIDAQIAQAFQEAVEECEYQAG